MRKPYGPLRLVAAMLATTVAAGLLVMGSVVPASAAGGPNLSPGKATQAGSSTAGYPVSAINDGDQNTYWESANNSFPQWARIDLGTATSVDQIVLKVPAPAAWQTRAQTLSVQGSADGTGYSTVVASSNYTFDPATGNKVTIDFSAATHRYWRVNVTANTGWPAAQISEFEIYAAAGSGDPGSNLAIGKEMVESGHVHTFVAANANDNNTATYWEGNAGYPNTLTVRLGANASVSSVVLKLNPDAVWGTRTQNIQVLGREQNATGHTNLVSAQNYTFNPASGGNTVTINLNATVADVQLKFASNTGAPAGQVAEFQVIGVPAPNPDLTVSALTWSPNAPIETNAITLTGTVKNIGTAASGATNVNFYLGGTLAAPLRSPLSRPAPRPR